MRQAGINKLKINYSAIDREQYVKNTYTYNLIIPANGTLSFANLGIFGIPFSYIIIIQNRNHTSYNFRFRIVVAGTNVINITLTSALTTYVITTRDGFLSYLTPTGIIRTNFFSDNFNIPDNQLQNVNIAFDFLNTIATPLNISLIIREFQASERRIVIIPSVNL